MRFIKPWILLLPTVVACSAAPEDSDLGAASEQLVGGYPATEAEYPATVSVNFCTATKVGPRHFLLAAHCIDPANLTTLSMSPMNRPKYFQQLTVESAHVMPEWIDCPHCGCTEPWLCDMVDHPDVALVIVEEETPEVPEAAIDDAPVLPGDPVVMTGYGCENGVDHPTGPSRFKVQPTVAVDPLLYSPDTPGVAASYVVTQGLLDDPNSASLCPGDSGGPLYRGGIDRQLVVGVNALLAWSDESGVSFANWHTRVDEQSSLDVFSWLESLGANVETGPSCGDGVLNGGESDVDCGGPCGNCSTGQACSEDADCMSRDCEAGLCAPTPPVPNYGPCRDLCESPTEITTKYFHSGSLGTGEQCFQSAEFLDSAACGGFTSPRTLTINGEVASCGGAGLSLPAPRNGGYCFHVSEGNESWAWFNTW